MRVTGGKVTFECNDVKFFDAIEPGSARVGPAEGRVGVGSFMFTQGIKTQIMNIEVRRLPGQ